MRGRQLPNPHIKIGAGKPFTQDQIARIKADYIAMGGERR